MKFLLGELFCGAGGLALGAHSAKIQKNNELYEIVHSWANDFDKDSCDTYTYNICPKCPETVYCQDVRKLKINELPRIDAFAYGFPCNDFSVVGEQKGINGNFGPLYSYGVKVLDFHKPKFFVAENVGGITSANDGMLFKKIITDLENSGNGYVLTVHIYHAEEYGVPQARHRVIIVGFDQTTGLRFRVPKPTTKDSPISARQAIENPPIPQDAYNNEITNQSTLVKERLRYIKPGENAWTAHLPEHLKLNVKNAKLSQIYKRLDPNKPSYTITGSGGGGTHGYHWSELRALTNRERARLQTFPDDFIFLGSKESVRKQIGMAVPPKLSHIIFTAILKTLAGIRYESIQSNIHIQQDSYNLFKKCI
jgi:DNA (cytosine-5)-methyltransferase 1